MATVNALLFVGAFLVLIGVLSSLVALRFGAPLLLVFLALGMLAGEDGPGGIVFADYYMTYLVGSIALAIILFDGGLRTRIARLGNVLAPAGLMATAGVLITAALVAVAAMVLFDFSILEGFLLGSIVASTDAAAVFFLIRAGGLQLVHRTGGVLEVESSTNDPVAVFMVIACVELLMRGAGVTTFDVVLDLSRHAIIGLAAGAGGGYLLTLALNRLELPSGLHPLFVVAGAICIFAIASMLHGSGFLAAYVAGLVVGNRPVRAYASIVSFHDAVTWLAQLVMFVMLGLLATPSRLVELALPALGIAVFLILIARPIATIVCLLPFRFPAREIGFMSWVGLRGAVSIFLAAIPMLSGVPQAQVYFDIAFFVVLVSLIVQGWTVNALAIRLKLALPQRNAPAARVELDLPGQLDFEMVGYPIGEEARVLSMAAMPGWARPVLVVRDATIQTAAEAGTLRAGDYAYFLAPPLKVHRLDRLFASAEAAVSIERDAEFVLMGSAPLGQLNDLYDLRLDPEDLDKTLAEIFVERFDETPQLGDTLQLGHVRLVVRAFEGEGVSRVGLSIEDGENDRVPAIPKAWTPAGVRYQLFNWLGIDQTSRK